MRESRGLMGLPAPLIGYDGVVQIGQSRVQVSDGVLQMGQRRLFVEEDGTVMDEKQQPIAKVVNGQLMGAPAK